MKRLFSLLLVLALAIGCVGSAAAQETTTLRIAFWGGQKRADTMTATGAVFTQKNPDIKVEVEYADWGGYWSKLATQIAGNIAPDVIMMDYSYFAQYVDNGVLANLDPYIEAGKLDTANLSANALQVGTINDSIYAMPCGMNAWILAYRPDVLAEAGLTMPETITYEEFLEMNKIVYEKTGRQGSSLMYYDHLRFTARCYGGNLYKEDGSALAIEDPAMIAKVWQAELDGLNEGWIRKPEEKTNMTGSDKFAEDTWCDPFWIGEQRSYEMQSGCELEMVAYPMWSDATQSPTYMKPAQYWAMLDSSEHKEEAIRLLDFLINDPAAGEIIGTSCGMPTNSVVREHILKGLDEIDADDARMGDWLNADPSRTSPIMKVDIPAHSDISATFTEYTEQVQYGLVDDLYAHAEAFIEEANEIIARSNAK